MPLYNYKGVKGGLYCDEHKMNGMVDVKHKRCKEIDCTKRPTYNYKSNKNGLYCVEHKLDGIIDVKHKKCKKKGCTVLSIVYV